jgi:hypothetical protein
MWKWYEKQHPGRKIGRSSGIYSFFTTQVLHFRPVLWQDVPAAGSRLEVDPAAAGRIVEVIVTPT